MNFFRFFFLSLLISSFSILLQCTSSNPASPNNSHATADLHYQITFNNFDEDSISIKLTSYSHTEFILPYHFFDNPVNPINGDVVKDLIITDNTGNQVTYKTRSEKIGPVYNTVLTLSGMIHQPVTFTYKINSKAFSPDEAIDSNPFELTDSTLFFIGASSFIIPYQSSDLNTIWRSPQDIAVTVQCNKNVPLFGVPSSAFSCRDLYELLFCQFFIGKKPFLQGTSGLTSYSFLDFDNENILSDSLPNIEKNYSSIVNAIEKKYGPYRGGNITIGLFPIRGGLEGTFSFIQIGSTAADFYDVLSHETLHHYIGIRCGEYDDPWWKEGGTTYLSDLIALRLNLYNKDEFKKRMVTKVIYADSSRFRIALSDQWLRANMFPERIFPLVYDKGSQVMMLLDYRIRTASHNRYSIEDVSSYLVQQFDGRAFHRSDFVNAIRNFCTADVQDIFKVYVDSAGVYPSDSLLNFTYNKLDSLHAF